MSASESSITGAGELTQSVLASTILGLGLSDHTLAGYNMLASVSGPPEKDIHTIVISLSLSSAAVLSLEATFG